MAYRFYPFIGHSREASLQSLIEVHPDRPKHPFLDVLCLFKRKPVPSVDVSLLRKKLYLTQEEFAREYGLSLLSVRNWEQRRRSPQGPAKILLALIDKEPETTRQVIQSLATVSRWERTNLEDLRRRLDLNQREFARRYDLSLLSVRNWEQRRRRPQGPAKILLALIDKEPETIQRILDGITLA